MKASNDQLTSRDSASCQELSNLQLAQNVKLSCTMPEKEKALKICDFPQEKSINDYSNGNNDQSFASDFTGAKTSAWNPLKYAISGSLAGLVTKTTLAPLERIRLLLQLQGMFHQRKKHFTVSVEALQAPKYCGVFKSLQTIVHEEGFTALWRGNVSNMSRAACVYAVKFASNDFLKEKFHISSSSSSHLPSILMTGFSAGLIQKLASFPLDLISVRMALGINARSLGKGDYPGIISCIRRIWSQEGKIFGFYKGLGPTLSTGVPYVMLQLTFFDIFKSCFNSYGHSNKTEWERLIPSSALSGSLANLVAQFVVFPGDTIRKRMMSDGVDGHQHLYKNSLDCAKKIWQHEGWKAFYKGLWPSSIKAIPSGAIQFTAYEGFKRLLGV